MDYAYDYDADGDRVILCDAPDGSIGVWNTGIAEWQARGLSTPEVDALVASGEFRRHFKALRDVLHLTSVGPFEDEKPGHLTGDPTAILITTSRC